MPLYRLTKENFHEILEENEIVIVDFWAEWCSTCSSFKPVYMEISENYPDIVFGKVNTQFEQDISIENRIQSIPTLIGYRQGKEVYRKVGSISGQLLEEIVNGIINKTLVS